MASDKAITENKLVTGWPAAPRVRVRQARAADLEALAEVSRLAGAPFEGPIRDAITSEVFGTALRAGLRGDHTACHKAIGQRYSRLLHDKANPLAAYLDAGLALVAEHRDHGVVGGLVAYPPVTLVEGIVDQMHREHATIQQIQKLWMLVGVALTRVKALAVFEHARGANIGGSLLKRARQVYAHCGFQTLYGAMPDTAGLDRFYQRAGFTVLDHHSEIDLSVPFGMDFRIWPAGQERLFTRDCD
ncbi:GNAT family N-acetyltransferase [Actinokineospora enzanensis]|uniref:GNAT family N-acetyltransferase n=1 Tax=Actinokineospora enzanensis TaxID=155975 RepID=UPI000369407D|nr:GNAT family N-acetyltransferase [Actinokineospora enzanensis]